MDDYRAVRCEFIVCGCGVMDIANGFTLQKLCGNLVCLRS
jgi:hypothetical protein